ncbi:fungal specific transcription factor [Colletotrichum camelliae]|nr:fungal specific transcription factor [Colletotrichum camelliae]KAH0433486.1 fungal specific transcription factor [Colletotrichum camelliae]
MSTANRDSESPQNSPAPKTARGVMNCRPCQIRKIKCDRALPACGVCHLYQRSCFYEGVPKKRGPKKESLSALIRRIDGLEELLKSDKTPTPPGTDIITSDFPEPQVFGSGISEPCGSASSDISPFSNFRGNNFEASSDVSTTINADGLVDVYFTKFHRNPYDILDEFTTRQSHRVLRTTWERTKQSCLWGDPSDGIQDGTAKRVFWTCYIMNTFVSTWLERPSLMDDSLIKADIQSSRQSSHNGWGTSNDFVTIPNNDFRRISVSPKEPVDEIQKLVWMAQILSEANRYLLLSDTGSQAAYCQRHKILHDLDVWASSIGTSTDVPTESQGGPGMNIPLICRLVVHLIHCLINRPILPLRLNEPSCVKMIQHWAVEATETAFRHATAILELVGQARETTNMPLPPFVGFCIFTAATVLNYGIHYAEEQIPEALAVNVAPFAGSPIPASFFASSRDLYSRSLDELSILSDTFTSARLYLLRLDELKSEHVALLNGKVTGYVPTFSNRFFQRYSPALLRRVQGFQTGDSTTIHSKMSMSQSPSSATHDERFGKESNPSAAWNAAQPIHTSRPSFTVPHNCHYGQVFKTPPRDEETHAAQQFWDPQNN